MSATLVDILGADGRVFDQVKCFEDAPFEPSVFLERYRKFNKKMLAILGNEPISLRVVSGGDLDK